MIWHFTPYAVPLTFCAVILFSLVIVCWQRKATQGAIAFAGMCLGILAYTVGYLIEIGSLTTGQVLTSLKIQYLSVLSPGLILVVVLHYTGDRRWLSLPVLVAIFLPAFITLMIAATNEYHGLIWTITELNRDDGFTRTIFTPGSWYWVNLLVTRGLLIVCLALLVWAYQRHSAEVYRGQIRAMILSILVVVVTTIVYLIGVFPPGLDIIPYGFTLCALIMARALFHHHFLDIMPIAREAILEGMREAVVVLDSENRLIYLNRSALTITQFKPEAVIGKPATEVFAPWRGAIKGLRVDESREEEISVMIDGVERHFQFNQVTLGNNRRDKTGRVLVLTDISRRVQSEKLLQQAYADREKLVEDLDAFAHMVAHDLKNPLGAIIGLSDLLADEHPPLTTGDRQNYLRSIFRSAIKADAIVDALLLLARIRTGVKVERSTLDMGKIVEDVLMRLRLEIEESGAQITLPSPWCPAVGYGPWVEEIWANYVSNAIKYGGKPPVIELGCSALSNGMVEYWVRDNGVGLQPEQISKLFVPFTRLGEIKVKGYGLGLTVVHRIVQELGGTVGVDSQPGLGSRFYFTLPAASGAYEKGLG